VGRQDQIPVIELLARCLPLFELPPG